MLKIPILGKVIMWCDSHKMYGAIVVFVLVFGLASFGYAISQIDTKVDNFENTHKSTETTILEKLDNLQVQSQEQYKEIRADLRVLMQKR